MLQRTDVVAAIAALSIIFSALEASASSAPRYSRSEAWVVAKQWSAQQHWPRTKEFPKAYWSIYADLSYYANPEYFSRCYRRTRIETPYGVAWRPIRICN
jgi:hypothetical protein